MLPATRGRGRNGELTRMDRTEREVASLVNRLIQIALPVIKKSGIPGFICRGESEIRRASGSTTEQVSVVVIIGEPELQEAVEQLVERWRSRC